MQISNKKRKSSGGRLYLVDTQTDRQRGRQEEAQTKDSEDRQTAWTDWT